jgi:hypothetical protein
LRRLRGSRSCRRSGGRALLSLHPIEHAQGRIDAGLRGLSVAAGYAKLRIAAAQEETGTASGAVASIVIIIVITHRRPMPSIPVAISVTIPFVAAFTPASAIEVITISRGTLAPR